MQQSSFKALERVLQEIEQEKQMRDMLEASLSELKLTVDELDKRSGFVEDEGSEWKTRYETQVEINEQLQRQIVLLQDKVDNAKRNLREAQKPPGKGDHKVALDMQANMQSLKNLDRKRSQLGGQLRDLEWRLDNEAKGFHKANEERKQLLLEIKSTKGALQKLKGQQRKVLHQSNNFLESSYNNQVDEEQSFNKSQTAARKPIYKNKQSELASRL